MADSTSVQPARTPRTDGATDKQGSTTSEPTNRPGGSHQGQSKPSLEECIRSILSRNPVHRPQHNVQGKSPNNISSSKSPETITPALVKPSAQESYPLFPVNKYAFDSDEQMGTRRYTFFNGATISATPRIDVPGVSENIVRADEKLMEWMSKGHDATAPSYVNGKEIPPMVEVMDYPEKPSTAEFIFMCRRIRSVLSSGRAVALVPKTMGPTYEWSEEAIGHLITNLCGAGPTSGRYDS